MIADGFGKRAVPNLPLQHAFELRVAARDRIPHDDKVDLGSDVFGGIACHYWDAFGREEIAHRRIHVLIRAPNVMAATLQERSERRHRRAADADQVNPPRFGTRDSGFDLTQLAIPQPRRMRGAPSRLGRARQGEASSTARSYGPMGNL